MRLTRDRSLLLVILLVCLRFDFYAQKSPDEQYKELFNAVQMAGVFKDSKTFVDCIPLYSPKKILKKYEGQKKAKNFDLKEFVLKNFRRPKTHSTGFMSDSELSIEKHINKLWPVLTRQPNSFEGSLLPLPYPYIVPGGRFGEIYYWDSYFTMLGLKASGKHTLIKNMVDNFSFLIDELGFVPNGNRTYYTSRSQPPFFSLMLRLLAEVKGDSILKNYLSQLEKEYKFWMKGNKKLSKNSISYLRVVKLPGGEVLNRYWDDKAAPRPESYKEDVMTAVNSKRNPTEIYRNIRSACESGWDFSSRWLRDGKSLSTIYTTEIIPVDLNSLMYHLEITIADIYTLKGNKEMRGYYLGLAKKRKSAILKYCWNESEHFFMDFDFIKNKSTGVLSLAALYPIFFKIASKEQAHAVFKRVELEFLKTGGLVTTLNYTGHQWDSPNGWAPLQWIAIKGLRNYGFKELASKIKNRWIGINVKVYQKTGKLVEKYNVVNIEINATGGEYPLQDGFGWTNGVLLDLLLE
jgi:alpha,alpha-trehalase